jgi:hypothetical protein
MPLQFNLTKLIVKNSSSNFMLKCCESRPYSVPGVGWVSTAAGGTEKRSCLAAGKCMHGYQMNEYFLALNHNQFMSPINAPPPPNRPSQRREKFIDVFFVDLSTPGE